jgi:hypothetical protein
MLPASKYILKNSLAVLLVTVGLLASSTPALAHHAFSAEFDAEQPVEVKGTVTKFELVNPHSWIWVDVKEQNGTLSKWGFEFGAPFSLKEKGITKSSIVAGTEITLKGYRSKSGKNLGYAVTGTTSDGHTFQANNAVDAPPAPVSPVAK